MPKEPTSPSRRTTSGSRAQFSIEALFYLLALATLIITFIFLFSTTADKIKSRQNLPAMRLAGDKADMLLLNPDIGIATRDSFGHALSHACSGAEGAYYKFDRPPQGQWTYCVTRACSLEGELSVLYVCV